MKKYSKQHLMIDKIVNFIKTGVWQIDITTLPLFKALPLRALRVIILAARTFSLHDCAKNATVLTYYSILNIVPLIAVVFALAKGFGLDKVVEKQILGLAQTANWQVNFTNQLIGFSRQLLAQAKGGVIAGVGVVLLLWTVLSILEKVEASFNAVWDVKKHRTLVRQFTDYLSVIVIAPLLFAMSSSINVASIHGLVDEYRLLGVMGPFITFLLQFLPFFMMWLLLAAVYLIMPNTKVPIVPAIIAAVCAGTAFQIVQWAYITFQIGVAGKSAIYGSFAALPLFLGWLQISWMIFLFGAEIAHAVEHHETFGLHPDYGRLGKGTRRLFAVRIFHHLAKTFETGEKAPAAKEIAVKLRIPLALVQELLAEFIAAGIVAETRGPGQEICFQPARAVEEITIGDIINIYERNNDLAGARDIEDTDAVTLAMKQIAEAASQSPGNVKLKDL